MNKIKILGLLVGCSPCNEMKESLDDKGINYTFYNAQDPNDPEVPKLKGDLVSRGIRSVPAVWINDEFVGTGDEAYGALGL